MISFKRAYVATVNGKEAVFASLEEAQQAEVKSLAAECFGDQSMNVSDWTGFIVRNKNRLIEILTLNDASRPKARGVKKPRRKAAETQLPLEGKAA